jgi:hypothetical protein
MHVDFFEVRGDYHSYIHSGAGFSVTIIVNNQPCPSPVPVLLPRSNVACLLVCRCAGGTLLPYYLSEEAGWQTTITHLREQSAKAKAEGKHVRALVVINPGNPTGQVLDRANQQELIEFCKEVGGAKMKTHGKELFNMCIPVVPVKHNDCRGSPQTLCVSCV